MNHQQPAIETETRFPICDDCRGTGKVTRELNMPYRSRYAVEDIECSCLRCNGEGFIEIEIEEEEVAV